MAEYILDRVQSTVFVEEIEEVLAWRAAALYSQLREIILKAAHLEFGWERVEAMRLGKAHEINSLLAMFICPIQGTSKTTRWKV
jgi:hypothetical protein